uniref:Calcium channel, voltage-dependent, gamma subunit 6b n=1 Tax=Pygocentrus nattereri TaxID=42514 RepID=A0A3B4EMW9_PYGNA
MWSTFIVQDEESRPSAASGGGAGTLTGMMGVESQEGKIKFAFFVAAVGITLTVLGVGTEFWVELAPSKGFHNNQTCLAAHHGLWKSCTKMLWVADVDPERESCGPLDLPGESNCTFFKFYTTGENTVLFQKTPAKSVLVFLSLIVFHQSVLSFLASDHTIPLHYELSWSVTCVGCAGAMLVVAGASFLLLALPYSPWEKCPPCRNNDS